MKRQAMLKKTSNAILTTIAFFTMFLFGFMENIKGVSYPLIKAEFGVPYDTQGGMISVTWFGYVAFCLLASLFLQRYGTKKALLAGYAALIIGAAATMAAPSFLLVTGTLVIMNFGFGFFEVGTNALGIAIFTKRTALMMSFLHFFYGFGSIVGPYFAGILTANFNFNWRQVYLAAIIPLAFFGILLMVAKFDRSHEDRSRAKITFLQAVKMPLVWIFSITLGFMEVVEFGVSNWGGLYLHDVFGLDVRVAGAAFVATFYVLFTASRLVGGFAVEKIGYMRSLYVSAFALIAVYAVGFGLGIAGIGVLTLSGIFIAILWPTIISVVSRTFGDDAPIVSSAIITISGAVNGVFQWVIGLTDQYIGKAWGFRSNIVYSIAVVVMLTVLSFKLKKREAVR